MHSRIHCLSDFPVQTIDHIGFLIKKVIYARLDNIYPQLRTAEIGEAAVVSVQTSACRSYILDR